MILYPTETLYALGVNAFDEDELRQLFELKERSAEKAATWLVRNIADIERFAELSDEARKIAERYLPGALTLVLKVTDDIPDSVVAEDRTIGFRVSSDPKAQELIEEFMLHNAAPLTCTSANVSGAPTLQTPDEILQQFGSKADMIETIIDGGSRKGLASTVVRVVADKVEVLREGDVSEWDIRKTLKSWGSVA